jgi:hypothetical protein
MISLVRHYVSQTAGGRLGSSPESNSFKKTTISNLEEIQLVIRSTCDKVTINIVEVEGKFKVVITDSYNVLAHCMREGNAPDGKGDEIFFHDKARNGSGPTVMHLQTWKESQTNPLPSPEPEELPRPSKSVSFSRSIDIKPSPTPSEIEPEEALVVSTTKVKELEIIDSPLPFTRSKSLINLDIMASSMPTIAISSKSDGGLTFKSVTGSSSAKRNIYFRLSPTNKNEVISIMSKNKPNKAIHFREIVEPDKGNHLRKVIIREPIPEDTPEMLEMYRKIIEKLNKLLLLST